MLVVIIDQGDTGIRSGRAGDAVRIVKRSRRHTRVSLVDPKGRVFKSLAKRRGGRRPAPLAMHPASPRDTVLTQALENAVMAISVARTGS